MRKAIQELAGSKEVTEGMVVVKKQKMSRVARRLTVSNRHMTNGEIPKKTRIRTIQIRTRNTLTPEMCEKKNRPVKDATTSPQCWQ